MRSIKHIVKFSGGLGSAVVAKMVVEKFGKENVELIYNDTGLQHSDTFRFMGAISRMLGVEYKIISRKNLFLEIRRQKCFPSCFIPWCTRVLKVEPFKAYIKNVLGEYVIYNGFTFDEYKRVIKSRCKGEVSPLFDEKISSNELKGIVKSWGVEIPVTYKYFKHNNCIPCFKAGKEHWFRVWKYFRFRYNQVQELEKELQMTVFKGVSLEELALEFKKKDSQLCFV